MKERVIQKISNFAHLNVKTKIAVRCI